MHFWRPVPSSGLIPQASSSCYVFLLRHKHKGSSCLRLHRGRIANTQHPAQFFNRHSGHGAEILKHFITEETVSIQVIPLAASQGPSNSLSRHLLSLAPAAPVGAVCAAYKRTTHHSALSLFSEFCSSLPACLSTCRFLCPYPFRRPSPNKPLFHICCMA